ncbi:conserved membrane protein of unknown function [Nitrospira japonica]|uniref:Uncharacterized protein n=1 Tax=Nitrospira japonica TaxID=1325564 RepID=A0A1W1I7P3_9BACT|nr:hypothetical protein [Nitrospira japonica]SLM49026.1 conserved membrane protein of unknown function [Nitrospira japonica]
MPRVESSSPDSCPPYTLFDDGPAYRIEEKLGLLQDGRRRMGRRVLFALLVAWLPMLLLAAVQGLAMGPTRLESFLMDFIINVRFLITVPVLLVGESICEEQLRTVVRQFLDAHLVKVEIRARFDAIVRKAVDVSRSGLTDGLLVGVAYLHSLAAVIVYLYGLHHPTWRAPSIDGHITLSLAGYWYILVAFPLYAFLLWRWLFRIGMWWWFLRQVSKLNVQITPSHRDGVGGLGFLSDSVQAFVPFAFAEGALVAGTMADFVMYEGDSPFQYQWHVVGFVVIILILIVGPLWVFMRPLYKAKEEAAFRYGALASRQIQLVEERWIHAAPKREDLDASMPDFRSVTHLGHSVAAVRNMSIFPLQKDDVIKLIVMALLPLLPVAVTQIPMGEVFSLLLKVVI